MIWGLGMEHIEECISFLLGKAHQHVMQDAKQRLAPFGVTPGQYAVLKVLWEQDGQSGAAIGERLQLDSASMTGLLDRLAAAGLIARQPHPADRRINLVMLTEQGRALHAPLDREMDAMNAAFFGAFPPDEAARLRTVLAAIGQVEVPT